MEKYHSVEVTSDSNDKVLYIPLLSGKNSLSKRLRIEEVFIFITFIYQCV